MRGAATLSIEGVRKRFGETVALDGVSLALAPGEFVTLLGDSGCGKTTLLRVVAGFTAPDDGRVRRDSRDITHDAPARRAMGFVFQSYALFPTKTVADNIGFALRVAGRARAEREARVRELARLVELERMLDRFPHELSGGQQQRVALARALAPEPDILLLDEPLSALDARIRARLRDELRAIVDRLGVTALYVTHDQEEALALSDRVAVMRQGRIEQVGSPAEIYHRPGSRFVAEFVGVANIVDGRAVPGGVEADGVVWPAPGLDGASGAASVVYRPEHLALAAPGADGLSGRVEAATFLGPVVRLRVALAQGRTVVVDRASTELPESWRPGAGVVVQPRRERATVLPAAR